MFAIENDTVLKIFATFKGGPRDEDAASGLLVREDQLDMIPPE
jgi:hypothetical protein